MGLYLREEVASEQVEVVLAAAAVAAAVVVTVVNIVMAGLQTEAVVQVVIPVTAARDAEAMVLPLLDPVEEEVEEVDTITQATQVPEEEVSGYWAKAQTVLQDQMERFL